MVKTKKIYWTVQITSWALYGLVSNLANYLYAKSEFSFKFPLMIFLFAFLGIFITHGVRAVILRFNWLNLNFLSLVPRLLVLILVGAFCFVEVEALISILFRDRPFSYVYTQMFELNFFFNLLGAGLLLVLWIGMYYAFHYFNRSYEQELANLRLQNSKNEIELKNLKTQLNPHFLFNSLNSIRTLISIDQDLAKEAITKLSSLLRSFLITNKQNLITIDEELAIVRDYLVLEKIRFEDRLDVTFHIQEGEVEKIEVPPFIIQTLIENAIKHGVSKKVDGGKIILSISKHEGLLVIKIENSGELNGSNTDTGVGVANITRRLSILYHEKANFRLYEEKNGMVVSEVNIQIDE